MEYLWSPWRMKYIQNKERPEGCVFCNALEQADGLDNLIVARASRSFIILNRYPYNNGHLMVVPVEHAPSIEDLDPATRQEMMELINISIGLLRSIYQPAAFNVGANIGAAAGAGVAEHVHFHVVPRWNGDTNFMTVVGETRVLPEEMIETYRHLREGWDLINSDPDIHI
jgi:ATP adenylyltransferase